MSNRNNITEILFARNEFLTAFGNEISGSINDVDVSDMGSIGPMMKAFIIRAMTDSAAEGFDAGVKCMEISK